MNTYEGITSIVGYILRKISMREEIEIGLEEIGSEDETLWDALEGQAKIGWKPFCQGFYHVDWATTQQTDYRRKGLNTRTLNIKRWKKQFSTILTDYSLECWKLRNESIHGNDIHSSREKQLEPLRKKVKSLYRQRKELGKKEEEGVFSMPILKRLRLGLHSTKLWVGMAEEVLRLHRERAIKNTLHHWLQP